MSDRPAAPVPRCATCGFDASAWTPQDLARTLAHTEAFLAGWSWGRSDAPTRAHEVGDDVHALWHALVDLDAHRRAEGGAVARQHGTVAQLNRSGGGVPKHAVLTAAVDHGGVIGDVQATRAHHGRPWQALCLWSAEVIDALVAEGHPIAPGAAGENVTIAGIDWATLRAGTIIDIGSVRCQLSAPSTPCAKNRRWFRNGAIDRMDHDRNPGSSRWYATVLHPGTISTGDPVVVEPSAPPQTAIGAAMRGCGS